MEENYIIKANDGAMSATVTLRVSDGAKLLTKPTMTSCCASINCFYRASARP